MDELKSTLFEITKNISRTPPRKGRSQAKNKNTACKTAQFEPTSGNNMIAPPLPPQPQGMSRSPPPPLPQSPSPSKSSQNNTITFHSVESTGVENVAQTAEPLVTDDCDVLADDYAYEVEITGDEDINDTLNDDNEDDIYGDLESSIFTSRSQKPVYNEEFENKYQALLKELKKSRAEIRTLTKENKVYASNISSLFLTAKTEVEKKNFIIKQLQEKLKNTVIAKAHGASMSKTEIEKILRECEEARHEAHSKVTLKEIKLAIDQMKESKVSGRKRQFRFGNMSLYFHRESSCIKRSTPVTFPDLVAKNPIPNNEEPTRLESTASDSLNPIKNISTNSTKVEIRESSEVQDRSSRDRNDEMPNHRSSKKISTECKDSTSYSSRRRESLGEVSSHSSKDRSPISTSNQKSDRKSLFQNQRDSSGNDSNERKRYSESGASTNNHKIESRNYKPRGGGGRSPAKRNYNRKNCSDSPSPSKGRKRKCEPERDAVTSRLRSADEGCRNSQPDAKTKRHRNDR